MESGEYLAQHICGQRKRGRTKTALAGKGHPHSRDTDADEKSCCAPYGFILNGYKLLHGLLLPGQVPMEMMRASRYALDFRLWL